MDTPIAEPPLPNSQKTVQGKPKAKKLEKKTKPALCGFSHFELLFMRAERFLQPYEQYIGHKIKRFYFNFTKSNGLNKTFGYRLALLVVLSLVPWISQASVSQEEYSALMNYSEPLDPIQAGKLERNLSQYTIAELQVDPEKIILSEMEKNEELSLQQQLSINENKNIDVPERQDPTYELRNGETITQVAQKFDLHVGTILDANNLSPTDLKKIKPGTIIKIPSSDTNTSDAWLVAINEAEERARQEAIRAQQEATRRQQQTTRVATGGVFSYTQRGSGGSSNVSVIGYSNEQCVPWARENSGINIRGYAGNVGATQSEPRVGGVALDRFYGHASVVVSVGDDYIVVHEANYIPGRITERTVSKSAIRGYVY